MKYYQQGDVILIKIDKKDLKLDWYKTKTKSPVIQLGESTGHAHRIQDVVPTIHADWRGDRILELKKAADLTHEEHKVIKLPKGFYRIQIVREFDHFAELPRPVRD